VWIPRPPSALPRREEGRERRVNLCWPLFVRQVSRSIRSGAQLPFCNQSRTYRKGDQPKGPPHVHHADRDPEEAGGHNR
jgi:hypothetical protein